MIYELVAGNTEDWHFPNDTRSRRNNALNFYMTCHQIHYEMGLLPYSTLSLHVDRWLSFISWLRHRTQPQLWVITIIKAHAIIILDGVRDHHELDFHEPTNLVPANTYKTWPKLPNLQTLHVYLHAYQRHSVLDPRLLGNKALWDRRAQVAADTLTKQVSLLHQNDQFRITGEWVEPWPCNDLDVEQILAKSGYKYDPLLGYWVYAPLECRWCRWWPGSGLNQS